MVPTGGWGWGPYLHMGLLRGVTEGDTLNYPRQGIMHRFIGDGNESHRRMQRNIPCASVGCWSTNYCPEYFSLARLHILSKAFIVLPSSVVREQIVLCIP